MCPVTMTALAVSAGITSATAAAVVGTAVSGALIGMGTTAAINVATGQSITSGLGKSALFGAVGGGFAGYAGAGLNTASSAFVNGTGSLAELSSASALFSAAPSSLSIGLGAAAGSLMGALSPEQQDYSQQSPQVQFANSQNIATTGSGGKQSAGSLAEAIKRSKSRKLNQQDVSDLSIDTGSFASSGLQLA